MSDKTPSFLIVIFILNLNTLNSQNSTSNITNSTNNNTSNSSFSQLLITKLNNTSKCTTLNDCFNCTLYRELSSNVKCQWVNNECKENSSKNKQSYSNSYETFFNIFNSCTASPQSITQMQTYCGLLSRQVPVLFSPIEINNKYLTKNMYCMIVTYNNNQNSLINITISSLKSEFDSDAVELLFFDGRKIQFNIQDSIWTNIYQGLYKITYHYYSSSESIFPQFEIQIKSAVMKNSNYTALIISMVVLFTICFGFSFIIWKCSKKIIEKNKKKAEEIIRRQVERENSLLRIENQLRVNLNRNLNRNENENEVKKNKIKLALKEMFRNELKPFTYHENKNEFHCDCTICIEDFNDNSIVVSLICKHVFHFECIKDWIKKQKGELKCPNCNIKIIPDKYLQSDCKEANKVENYNGNIENQANLIIHNHNQLELNIVNNNVLSSQGNQVDERSNNRNSMNSNREDLLLINKTSVNENANRPNQTNEDNNEVLHNQNRNKNTTVSLPVNIMSQQTNT